MKFIKERTRKKAKRRLVDFYNSGRAIAHLPAFLDREPHHNLHRALRSAFMRGFKAEQKTM